MLKLSNKQRGNDLDRVLLNLTNSQHPDDQITVRDLHEHILICGSTGTGKTSTVGYHLAKNILNKKNLPPEQRIGMIIFIYKSSDVENWIRWAEQNGREDDLMIIDSQDRDVINILEAYRDKEAISAVNTLMILSGLSLSGSSEQQSEAYWEQMNRQRLHRLILLSQLSEEPMSVATLYKLHSSAPQTPEQLESEDFRKNSYCWQMLAKAHNRAGEDDPLFQLVEHYFVREMPNMADRTQSSILSMTGSILEPFVSSPLLSRLFGGKTTLSLDSMLEGRIVILNLPIQQYEYAGKLAQMIFKHILSKRIEERDLSLLPNPVCFWIDEYQHFISKYDPLFLSTARSSRAGCVLLTQNVSNLFAQIGGNGKIAEEKVNALLALTNHKIFLSQNNSITNEFASKTIGMGIHRLTNSSVQIQQFSGSAGISETYHYQVMPRDFTMLKRGGIYHDGVVEAIITATGKMFSNSRNYLKVAFKQPWMR
jgi:hypothetical protein